MRLVTRTKLHHPGKLHEALRALPSWRPENTVQGDGTEIRLTVDDATLDSEIDAAINAHVAIPLVDVFEPTTLTRTLQTTNTTPTTMQAIPVPQNAISDAHVRVVCHNPATNATRMWWFWVAAQRATGNAQLIGTPQQAPASQAVGTPPAATAAVISVSGQNLVITCIGLGGQTLKWLAEIDARIRRPVGF